MLRSERGLLHYEWPVSHCILLNTLHKDCKRITLRALLSVGERAQALRVSECTIRRLCRDGRLRSGLLGCGQQSAPQRGRGRGVRSRRCGPDGARLRGTEATSPRPHSYQYPPFAKTHGLIASRG
jgi:hypothetical protein